MAGVRGILFAAVLALIGVSCGSIGSDGGGGESSSDSEVEYIAAQLDSAASEACRMIQTSGSDATVAEIKSMAVSADTAAADTDKVVEAVIEKMKKLCPGEAAELRAAYMRAG